MQMSCKSSINLLEFLILFSTNGKNTQFAIYVNLSLCWNAKINDCIFSPVYMLIVMLLFHRVYFYFRYLNDISGAARPPIGSHVIKFLAIHELLCFSCQVGQNCITISRKEPSCEKYLIHKPSIATMDTLTYVLMIMGTSTSVDKD